MSELRDINNKIDKLTKKNKLTEKKIKEMEQEIPTALEKAVERVVVVIGDLYGPKLDKQEVEIESLNDSLKNSQKETYELGKTLRELNKNVTDNTRAMLKNTKETNETIGKLNETTAIVILEAQKISNINSEKTIQNKFFSYGLVGMSCVACILLGLLTGQSAFFLKMAGKFIPG